MAMSAALKQGPTAPGRNFMVQKLAKTAVDANKGPAYGSVRTSEANLQSKSFGNQETTKRTSTYCSNNIEMDDPAFFSPHGRENAD